MRSSVLSRVIVSGAVVFLAACDSGSTRENQAESAFPAGTVELAQGGNTCGPKAHPAGTILGTVDAPLPWGVAVRDDGLTYFTELFNAVVGITNTTTRQITGTIPSGS